MEVMKRHDKKAKRTSEQTGKRLDQTSRGMESPGQRSRGRVVTRKSYQSQAELGRRLEISQQRVAKLVADPEWNWGRGPWSGKQAEEIETWLSYRRQENPASREPAGEPILGADLAETVRMMSPERKDKLKLLLTRKAKTQAELYEFSGNFIRREDVEHERVERIEAVKQGLRALTHTLPPRLARLGAEEMEKVLEDEFRTLCNRFAQG